ncbi:MAG TPA: AIPR family protein, partial [bacterium]|nr:AIPR family protein [bacterium]
MKKAIGDNYKYVDIVGLLRRTLETLSEEGPDLGDDFQKLFVYYIGQQLENIAPDRLRVCDRSKDQKIDFYDITEERVVAYQCKLPDIDDTSVVSPVTYGPDVINEIEDVLTFLSDDEGNARGNPCAQEARNRFRAGREAAERDGGTFRLDSVLAVFGTLTPAAKEKLEELRSKWPAPKYEVRVVDYQRIASELGMSLLSPERPDKIRLDVEPDSYRQVKKWGYALVPAREIFRIFDQHKLALFDLNVRFYLGKKTSINRQIIETLQDRKGQERFHLLNNGVTFSCNSLSLPKGAAQPCHATLHKPQIINGCQTVISLHHAYKDMDDDASRQRFDTHCLVPVRFIITPDEGILEDVVTASNNQNRMSARNLRSNSRTQRVLQRQFNGMSPRWYYQRKDMEFDNMKEHKPKNFRADHYQYGPDAYRIIDNERLAKAWMSFTGFSSDASEKLAAFDYAEDGGRYEWLFERAPNSALWAAITQGPQVALDERYFEQGSPASA